MAKEKGRNPKEDDKEGLPASANDDKKKNPIVFLILGLLIIGMGFTVYSFIKKNADNIPQIQENYSPDIQVQSGVDNTNTKNILPDKSNKKPDKNDEALIKARIAIMQQTLQKRISAPIMDNNSQPITKNVGTIPAAGAVTNDPNAQFMRQVSIVAPDTVNAANIGPLNYLVTEGSMIHATLETAVNSDLPGYLRAIVSEPVYSEDGSQVLIPAGSRLIGQYKSGMLQGQSRIFVVLTRLIIPGGISISLGSPGVDNLGVAGMDADAIDHHFWQQFGTAILLSVIGAGAQNVGVSPNDDYNAAQAYRVAIANSLSQTANQSLQQTGMIAPTLHINQGKAIMVFVAHDLNFKNAMQKVNAKINVF